MSAKYFKAAGYPSGKYEGKDKKISLVCDDDDPLQGAWSPTSS